MFGPIGGFELLVLVTLGLLVFGPRRLPEIGRTIGRTVSELRRAALEVRTSLEREVNLDEFRQASRSIRNQVEETLLRDPRRMGEEIASDLTQPVTAPPAPPAAPQPTPAASAEAPRTDAVPRG